MAHCKVGEKAYLRIEGDSEVWSFDGPIDIEIEILQGKESYPSSTPLQSVRVQYLFAYNDGYVQYIAQFSFFGLKSLTLREAGDYYGLGPRTYVTISTYTDQTIRYTGGEFVGWNPAYTNKSNNWTAWMFPERGWGWDQDGKILLRVYIDNLLIPNTPGKYTYRLKVNGNTIKESDSPIDYTVRCGDRCPPGQRWSDRCGKCVCEGMDGILAGLKGATAIARSIR